MMKMMHVVRWVKGRLNIHLEDLARLTIFCVLQIGLMLSFGPVEFEYPPGHWMRGFACVPLISVFAMIEYEVSGERLGSRIQTVLSIILVVWTVINSSLCRQVEVQHFLVVALAMETAVAARLLQPSRDDVIGSLSRTDRHLYALSDELPWILVPVVCFFWVAYTFNPRLFDLLCTMSVFSLLYKSVWRDWRRTVKLLEAKDEVFTVFIN
jgi:hypothetical protein